MVNSNTCANFRTDLSKALEALEKKYGMDIKVGTLRYTSNSISTKIDAAVLSAEVESQDQLQFNKNCIYFQLKKEDFGRRFTDDKGHIHKIVGIKPRSRKYPIVTRNISTNGDGMAGTTEWNSVMLKRFL